MMSSQSPSSHSSAGKQGGRRKRRKSKGHEEEAPDGEQLEESQDDAGPLTPEEKLEVESTGKKEHKKHSQKKTGPGDGTTQLAQKTSSKQPSGRKGGMRFGDTPTPWTLLRPHWTVGFNARRWYHGLC